MSGEPRKRIKLDDRQVRVAMKALIDFGYTDLTFPEVRKIADQVSAGTHSMGDPVARIIAQQIDEANEMRKEAGLPELLP